VSELTVTEDGWLTDESLRDLHLSTDNSGRTFFHRFAVRARSDESSQTHAFVGSQKSEIFEDIRLTPFVGDAVSGRLVGTSVPTAKR
jgi:hypothetical protein